MSEGGGSPATVARQSGAAPVVWLIDLAAGADVLEGTAQRFGLMADAGPPDGNTTIGVTKRRARAGLRILLAGLVGVEAARRPLLTGPAGKPALDPTILAALGLPTPQFSLAHADELALVALSMSGPVGVDLEITRSVRISSHRRAQLEAVAAVLVPERPLPEGPADARFLQAWVRLEALAKATGEGVSALFGRLGVRGTAAAVVAKDEAGLQGGFAVRDLAVQWREEVFAAVCHEGPPMDMGAQALTVRTLAPDENTLHSLVNGHWSPL